MDTTPKKTDDNLLAQSNIYQKLSEAVLQTDLSSLQMLIAQGFDLNSTNPEGQTALMLAVKKSNSAAVLALVLAPGISVNQSDNQGNTALTLAAYLGHDFIVSTLLFAPGILVNKPKSFYTPLMLAVQEGHLDVVLTLLNTPNILVNLKNLDGECALSLAINAGNTHNKIAKELLKFPNIETSNLNPFNSCSALTFAAKLGNIDLVSALLTVPGILVNEPEKLSDNTALMLAARAGHSMIVRLLLGTPGINITYKNRAGDTAISLAYQYKRTEVISLLEDKGAVFLAHLNVLPKLTFSHDALKTEAYVPLLKPNFDGICFTDIETNIGRDLRIN